MLFNKWLLCPVVSGLLLVGSSLGAIAQMGWVEIGRNSDSDIVKINPEVQISGAVSSVVMYEILILLNQPIDGLYALKVEMLARCESKSQAISSSDGLNQQGRVIKSNTVEISDLEWTTPGSDVYGKAFNMACNSR